MTTILIVEDEPMVQIGITAAVNREKGLKIVGRTAQGEKAIKLAHQLLPDIVLMDIGLKGSINGIEATRQIKMSPQNREKTKVLMITASAQEKEVLEVFNSGADGYCVKGIEPETLILAIKTTAEGSTYLDSKIAHYIIKNNYSPQPTKDFHSKYNLSKQESEILELLAKGYTNSEIAVYQSISVSTVKKHLTQIFGKLRVKDRTNAALKAYQEVVTQGQIHKGD